MHLQLKRVDKVLGCYSAKYLPSRMCFLHPEAAEVFEKYMIDTVVCSDMYRSAKESLRAIIEKPTLAQPPSWSAHNYGLAIDIDVNQTLSNTRSRSKKELDLWMGSNGWFCHRLDHVRKKEEWHYNFLGIGFAPQGKYTSDDIEQKIQRLYGKYFEFTDDEIRVLLNGQTIEAFQRKWHLTVDGIAGPKTKRVLAYVFAQPS